MSKIENFKGIQLHSGHLLNPGSGAPSQHEVEYNMFQNVLNRVDNKKNPTMVELGSHWALWSLCFKQKFNGGINILVELFKSRLEIGINNFKLNNYNFKSYHGGFYLDDSDDVIRPQSLTKSPPDIERGVELDIREILNENKIKTIDVLHLDIQGSELNLIKYLDEIGLLKSNINQLVIGTHSTKIHNTILNILKSNGFEVFDNIPCGKGGDGYLTAKIK